MYVLTFGSYCRPSVPCLQYWFVVDLTAPSHTVTLVSGDGCFSKNNAAGVAVIVCNSTSAARFASVCRCG